MTLIGLISDTHGLLRPKVAAALAGVCRILHAGDMGKPEVLGALSSIAPVTAVRGNVDDRPVDCGPSRRYRRFRSRATTFICMHNLNDIEIDPKAAG